MNTQLMDFETEVEPINEFAKYLSEHPEYLESSKEYNIGQIIEVIPSKINFSDKTLELYEKKSKTNVYVSFKDLTTDIKEIEDGNIPSLKVAVIKVSKANEVFASEKKSQEALYYTELFNFNKNNQFFKVKYTSLVNGGYLALYKDIYEVFVPGSLAGANVILDFKKHLNSEYYVMVDNYDKDNKLFIVSYKKYLNKALPYKIKNELDITKKYTAHLTNNPYPFGMFVEFDGTYTGLLHSSEFTDYNEIKKSYKIGDTIDVYVKDIVKKDKQLRITLTMDSLNTNNNLLKWYDLRLLLQDKNFNYTINGDVINIITGDTPISITVDPAEIRKNREFSKIRIKSVNIMDQHIEFDFTN